MEDKIFGLIEKEKQRLQSELNLIPSENLASPEVLKALGSVLTNKYSEGYPGKRYYGGNEYIDQVELLAIERAKLLFGAEHANVQPYSGSPANLAVYSAFLKPGDKLMGMSLSHGGHLTHGYKISFTGKWFNAVHYGVDEKTHLIDYDTVRKLALQEKPKIIVSGASAYPRKIDFKQFAEIAEEVGALSMADIAHVAGLIVGKVHPSPFPYTDIVTTTTHKTLRGPRGAIIMCKEEFAKKIDRAVFPGLQGGPHNNNIGAMAVAFREACLPEFKDYAKQIVNNAKALADTLLDNGLTLVSGGTDNHLMLIDVSKIGLGGQEAEEMLGSVGITANKNTIPFDQRPPLDPSGIRVGTPAVTTRGMKEPEMKEIGEIIAFTLKNKNSKMKDRVSELCKRFPLFEK